MTEASPQTATASRAVRAPRRTPPLLFEVSWEVCNQIGGIYQVLRSKAPAMDREWRHRYILVGPDGTSSSAVEFEERRAPNYLRPVLRSLAEAGVGARFGRWLISGRPRVLLLSRDLSADDLGIAKYHLWAEHNLGVDTNDPTVNDVVTFATAAYELFNAAAQHLDGRPVVAHFHEWMGGLAIPLIRRAHLPVATVFTTHATRLGRAIAPNTPDFYAHLSFYDDAAEAERYGLTTEHGIERACAHGAHVFTTVSDVTGEECAHLLGRVPDVVLPNGLNIQRFEAVHHLQSNHARYKEVIHRFTRSHFFPHYAFDLDRTLYLFTSGRYEPRNKGFDLCLEAAARLNAELKATDLDITVVFFIVTRRDGVRIKSQCLENRGIAGELYDTCDGIGRQFGEHLFEEVTTRGDLGFEGLIDEYWQLRLRRTAQAWRRQGLPPVATHDIDDGGRDPVLSAITGLWLTNAPEDPVKIVYHPEFITPANPLWKMEYDQFVRGCHLGVFPSAYEPWGYTPLECLASGVPAVSSDLAGFGRYVLGSFEDHDDWGAYVVRRRDRAYHDSAAELTQILLSFCRRDRRERIALRNAADEHAAQFDWDVLAAAYARAHRLALAQVG